MLVNTSPGLIASAAGIFSDKGITPTMLIFSPRLEAAKSVPATAAAPDKSDFMYHMPLFGFRVIPPVSNVIPLPTKAKGAFSFTAPLYLIISIRASCIEPRAVPSKTPMPSLRISSSFIMFISIFGTSANLGRTLSINVSGYIIFPGSVPKSLAKYVPSTT